MHRHDIMNTTNMNNHNTLQSSGAEQVMRSIDRFSTVAVLEDSMTEVVELQYQYSLQDGMAPWLVQTTADERDLLKSLQSQWYGAWTKVLKVDKDLIASRLCFGTDKYYVCMRTHGHIGSLYECETIGTDFGIKRPFIKITTLEWLRQAVAPKVEAAGFCVLQRLEDGGRTSEWITLYKPERKPKTSTHLTLVRTQS